MICLYNSKVSATKAHMTTYIENHVADNRCDESAMVVHI